MKKLYVEFTRPQGFSFISSMIMLFECTSYSHVRFQWEEESEGALIYEASGSSIKFLGKMAQEQHPVHVVSSFSLQLNKQQWEHFKTLRLQYAGLRYGVFQIIGIIISRLLFLKKNPFASGHISQICSEVVARILSEVLQLSLSIDFDMAGPKKIHNVLEKYAQDKHLNMLKKIM
ncbi:MAG: hypothetical protein AB8C84_04695 [Oligoflexales bacterium]